MEEFSEDESRKSAKSDQGPLSIHSDSVSVGSRWAPTSSIKGVQRFGGWTIGIRSWRSFPTCRHADPLRGSSKAPNNILCHRDRLLASLGGFQRGGNKREDENGSSHVFGYVCIGDAYMCALYLDVYVITAAWTVDLEFVEIDLAPVFGVLRAGCEPVVRPLGCLWDRFGHPLG